MLRKLGGEINQFRTASRQSVDIMQQPSSQRIRRLEDGSIVRYKFNNGHETLEVAPSEGTLLGIRAPQFAPDKPKARVPDFCVVDVVVPNSVEISAAIGFDVIAGEALGLRELDAPGVAPDPSEPLLYFARVAPLIDYASTITDRVASLRVDFRTLPEQAVIEFNLYGRAVPNEYEIVDYGPPNHARELIYNNTGRSTPNLTVLIRPEHDSFGHLNSEGMRIFHPAEPGDLDRIPGSPLLAYEFYEQQEYPPVEYIYDEPTGLIVKEIRRAYLSVQIPGNVGIGGYICPIHGTTALWRAERFAVERWAEWRIVETPGDPIYADEFETPADIVAGFYYDDARLLVGSLPHQDTGSAIWTVQPAPPTERTQVASVVLTDEEVPIDQSPFEIPLLGVVRITRDPPAVEFVPA